MRRRAIQLFLVMILAAGLGIVAVACSSEENPAKTVEKKAEKQIIALLETSLGIIEIRLLPEKAPKTVEHFVALAKGEKEWKDPITQQMVKRPLYDGTIFHRVIPGFIIQGGDPKGNGTGGAGYLIDDEIVPGLNFDKPGLLAMANPNRPNANSSQFFITEIPAPHLNGKNTIIGEVIQGLDVVKSIARTPRDARDRPKEEVQLKQLRIVERDAPPPAK